MKYDVLGTVTKAMILVSVIGWIVAVHVAVAFNIARLFTH